LDITFLGIWILSRKKWKTTTKIRNGGLQWALKNPSCITKDWFINHNISFSLIGASNQSKKTYYYLHPFAWCHGLMVWLLVTTEVKGGMCIGLRHSLSPIQRERQMGLAKEDWVKKNNKRTNWVHCLIKYNGRVSLPLHDEASGQNFFNFFTLLLLNQFFFK
jgi:hypothetical protein